MSHNMAYAFSCSTVQGREQAVSSDNDRFSSVQKKRLLNIDWQHRQPLLHMYILQYSDFQDSFAKYNSVICSILFMIFILLL